MGTSILNSAPKARIFFGQPNFSNDARGYAFKGKDLNLKNMNNYRFDLNRAQN